MQVKLLISAVLHLLATASCRSFVYAALKSDLFGRSQAACKTHAKTVPANDFNGRRHVERHTLADRRR